MNAYPTNASPVRSTGRAALELPARGGCLGRSWRKQTTGRFLIAPHPLGSGTALCSVSLRTTRRNTPQGAIPIPPWGITPAQLCCATSVNHQVKNLPSVRRYPSARRQARYQISGTNGTPQLLSAKTTVPRINHRIFCLLLANQHRMGVMRRPPGQQSTENAGQIAPPRFSCDAVLLCAPLHRPCRRGCDPSSRAFHRSARFR